MVIRIISSIIGFPILAFLVAMGNTPLQIGVLVISLIGMSEVYNAFSKSRMPIHYIGYFYGAVYIFILKFDNARFLNIFISIFIVSALVSLTIFHGKHTVKDCMITIFSFFYVAFLMSFIYLTRQHYLGEFFVWIIFICAWGCDTGAYFVGKSIGRHKLVPDLSPNKTVEGAIGGVVVAALIAYIYGLVVTKYLYQGDSIAVFCAVMAGVGSIFAQFGDLAASSIKRHTGIKDFGKLIPGHGGIIDRFDSVLFTAPCVYVVLTVLAFFSDRLRI